MSKSIPIALSIVLAQLFAVGAYAQTKGEVDPTEGKAPVVKKVSPTEKAEARAKRKAAGAVAAKSEKPAASTGEAQVAKQPVVPKISAEEKAAARAKRKAAAAQAVKKGETVEGEATTVK